MGNYDQNGNPDGPVAIIAYYYTFFFYSFDHFKVNSFLLRSKFLSVVNFIQNTNFDLSDNYRFYDIFLIFEILNKIPNAYPVTLKIITILLVSPVSTAASSGTSIFFS